MVLNEKVKKNLDDFAREYKELYAESKGLEITPYNLRVALRLVDDKTFNYINSLQDSDVIYLRQQYVSYYYFQRNKR